MNLQLTLAARYLAGRKLRTILTTLAVVFGVLVIFGMNILLPTMLTALQANAKAAQGVVDLTISHATGDAFPQAVVAQVAAIPGVRAAAASLNRSINLPQDFYDHDAGKADRVSVLLLVGIEPSAAKAVRAYPLLAGRYLRDGELDSALVTQKLASDLALAVGDPLRLPSVNGLNSLTVVGILSQTDPGTDQALVTLPEAQALTAQPGRITTVDLMLDHPDAAGRAEVSRAIQSALGPDYRTDAPLDGNQMVAALQAAQVAFSVFGIFALFMGAFIIFNTFRTVVVERRHDIGMLRAVGASRGTVIGIILTEGLLQGIVGTLLGLVFGYLAALGLIWLTGPLLEQFVNLRMGPPVVSPVILIVSIVLGVGVTVAAGLFPAMRVSHMTPLEALQSSGAEDDFRRERGRGFVFGAALIVVSTLALFSRNLLWLAPAGIVFLLGLVSVAPALVYPIAHSIEELSMRIYARTPGAARSAGSIGALARGNLARQSSRVAVTASASMLGLAVIIATMGLGISVTATLGEVLQKSLGSDYVFVPPSVALWADDIGADASLSQRLRSLDGVAEISTLRYAGSIVNGQQASVLGIDPVAFPEVAGLRFVQGDEVASYRALADGRAMIVNGAFLSATGTRVGDTVALATPGGPLPYHIVAMASDALNAKITTAYISQANLQSDFGKTEDVFLQVDLKPDADRSTLDTQIRAIAADYPQFELVAGRTYYRQVQDELDAAFVGVYVILGMLALPSLIAMLNTLAIGVIERTREIGMLRAVGATRGQIRAMVVAEALLLASIGTVFGILCGFYLGYVMVTAISNLYPVAYSIPTAGIAIAVLLGLLFGLLAAIIPARQAARLNVVEALRYE